MTDDKPKYPVVLLETSRGNIDLELWPDKAPVTVENFLTYVREGFYDGLIIHRVVHNFVVQTGGFEPGMVYRPPTHPPIKNEADNGLQNKRGTLAMARAYPINSAAAQFFINVMDNPKLNHQGPDPAKFGYAVFGRVLEGMDVVGQMSDRQGGDDQRVDDHVPERDSAGSSAGMRSDSSCSGSRGARLTTTSPRSALPPLGGSGPSGNGP